MKTEKEYLPILKYVMILSEKGVPTTVDSVACTMSIGAIDAKMNNGKWYIAKAEMVKRIRERGKKMEAIEAGYYSLHGFIYHLSEHGIDMYEDNVSHFMSIGKLECKRDKFGRYLISAHELKKRIEQFGSQK